MQRQQGSPEIPAPLWRNTERNPTRAISRLIWALVFLGVLWVSHNGVAQDDPAKNVLVLYSHEREMPMYSDLDKGLRAEVESDPLHPVVFYTEYLDLMRFSDERQQRKLVDYLQVKYSDRKMDLIVGVSPLAFNFLLANGEKIFPETPIVFASVNIHTIEKLSLRPNITGIAAQRDIRDTLNLALRLQPDTTRVVIPAGGSPLEKSWTEQLRQTLQPYESRLTIQYLAALPMSTILEQLKNLPPHTIVLFSSLFFYDGAGHYFLPEEALDLICRSSNAPVYGTDEPYLGLGIVGGHLYSLGQVGTATGKIGRRILAGEKPADIPVQTLDANRDMFDARQLKRWGIREDKLPAGSILRFSRPSIWALYRWYILGFVALFVVQSWLVILLVIQARKLRQSESHLKDLSGHLINAQEEERRRIARELHDDFAQRLALLRIEIDMLAKGGWHPDRSAEHTKLCDLRSRVDELALDIHGLSHRLHSSKLQYLGLQAALKDLCAQVGKQHRLAIDLQIDKFKTLVPADIALCLYRVAQEALNNVTKHSGATKVVVALADGNGLVRMRITDSGKGFDSSALSAGLGLASMRERLRLVGGKFRVQSKPGAGTELTAQVRVNPAIPQAKAS